MENKLDIGTDVGRSQMESADEVSVATQMRRITDSDPEDIFVAGLPEEWQYLDAILALWNSIWN